MTEKNIKRNPLEAARHQIKLACAKLNLPEVYYDYLKEPERFIEITIPVRMDDGSTRIFKGYRSQHSSLRGPSKGGIRFHPQVDADEVKALSLWMSFKCEIAGIPYGGGKGGITVDPHKLSVSEKERLARGWVRGLYRYIGEQRDIPAPDVNTDGQIMSWMADEYNLLNGVQENGTFTGKPLALGGSQGRTAATGYGVAIITQEALKAHGLSVNGARVAVQGFGNVGSYTVKCLEEMGAIVQYIAEYDDAHGMFALYSPEGLSYDALSRHKEKNGSLYTYPDAEHISIDTFFSADVDVLLPCALENAITADNASLIRAKMIVEGANGPVSQDADPILEEKGIVVVPDILANSGGVMVSYFEWVQNLSGYYWTEAEVAERQEEKMRGAFHNIANTAAKYHCPYREAAYVFAIERLSELMRLKGRV